jgi:uncharacterized protein YndB with AHSA1/START domain
MVDASLEPIRLSFSVECEPNHAFDVWTARASTWWPASHTVTGEGSLDVLFEPRVGGRIFERTPAGVEHEWGRIVAWEPPSRIVYEWHLRVDREDATQVEIRFLPTDAGGTNVEIEHRGWERLGLEKGAPRREGNFAGWGSLLPHYVEAANAAAPNQER